MTSTICIPVKSKCNVKFVFPESLAPCLQHKNNLRVNKVSLFLYLNRHVSMYKIHEKNSHKTVYIIIVSKCYLIKSYWYFISFHWSYSLLWSIKHQVLHEELFWCCFYSGFKKHQFVTQKTLLICQNWNNSEQTKSITAPVPLGIGPGLSSSLFHILRRSKVQLSK